MSDSEDESSDSSCDFLIPADKINLNSSFFQEQSVSKSNLKNPAKFPESSDSDEEELEDFKLEDVDNAQSAKLFSQILKNLEKEKNLENLKSQEFNSKKAGEGDSKDETSRSQGLAIEINQLLLQGESITASSSSDKQDEIKEENDEKPETCSEYTIPKEGVQVTLQGTNNFLDRKQQKKQDLQTLLRNKINQRIRTTQTLIHKVGLLWWLVYGFHLNRLANDSEILATCLSLITKNDYPKGRVDLVYLQRVTTWFHKTFSMHSQQEQSVLTTDSLLERINEKKIYDYREMVLLFLALLRAIGLNCRLIVSLCPPPLKPKREQLFQIQKEEEEGKNESKLGKSKELKKKSTNVKSKNSDKVPEKQKQSKKTISDSIPDIRKNAQMEARKRAVAVLKKDKSQEATKSESKDNLKTKKDSGSKSNLKLKSDSKKKSDTKVKLMNKSTPTDSKKEVIGKEEDSSSTRKLRQRITKTPLPTIETDEEDSDYMFIPMELSDEVKKPKTKQKNRKLISSDEEFETEKKDTQDVWVEVYVESEKNWIPVSIPTSKINCVKEIHKRAKDPILYVVAYNCGGSIKDVTRRYCANWLTVTRKQRVDENWWIESMKPWKEVSSELSKAEDELLLKRELELPLPKTVSECKGHPLYALARHLLKFEALYPPDVVPLGYLKNGEAIYSRHCVHTLRSRETWIKHARVVKPAQEAYKVVTSMPKYDKFSGTKIKGLPLDLFGKWQTMPYVPPEAKDGIVPRNEYGNVDLFKMCMLPKGTVYINLPALNRVARKLNIDCAPAVVGFNFKKVGAVPAFEGFVVCEEFEDTVRDAWETEQVEAVKRAKEKKEKRIYGNWRKLINGLLIRVKLAAKYSADHAPEESDSDSEQFAVIRKRLQAKRKKARSENQTAGKDSDNEIPVKNKKVLNKKSSKRNQEDETKLESKIKEKLCDEAASTSKRPKRRIVRKKIYREKQEEEEEEKEEEEGTEVGESDSDFEVKRPKRETRSQKNK